MPHISWSHLKDQCEGFLWHWGCRHSLGVAPDLMPLLAHTLQNLIKTYRLVSGLCLCFVLGVFLHGHFAQSQMDTVSWERSANEVRIALMQKENSLIMIPAFYRSVVLIGCTYKKTHHILNAGIMWIMIHVWQHSCIGIIDCFARPEMWNYRYNNSSCSPVHSRSVYSRSRRNNFIYKESKI